jgi:pyruvate,water dikinase
VSPPTPPAGPPPVPPLVLPLADAGAADAAGGKGASLGELARAGFPVPPGFVITVGAFAAAMSAADPSGELRAEIEALSAEDLDSIARVSAALRSRITGAPLPASVADAITAGYAKLADGPPDPAAATDRPPVDPPDVAVRSSATAEDGSAASFAGLQDTYLGVTGGDSVLESVRRCWASLYNAESIAYRRRLNLPESALAMAVVVQRMVRPRAAGVMFTRSPVTGDRSVVAIEGTWGLGSALVSGDVTPDSFVISKITGEITTRRVSSKIKIHQVIPNGPSSSPPSAQDRPSHQADAVTVADTPPELRDASCLTDDEIRALAAIARRVEAHYGVPQDIEWALLDEGPAAAEGVAERITLLQSRPETVWAAKDGGPVGTPKPRPADHVLALFGKPL